MPLAGWRISGSFSIYPILSLAAARNPETKRHFLDQLLNALLHVGFLYLSDTGIQKELVDKVCAQTRLFFDENALPLSEKEKIEMVNKPSFLGWSRVSQILATIDGSSLRYRLIGLGFCFISQ